MTKIISMFNHKGGVAKTTNAYNIGWALTQREKRVLLVDADSQCNLTSVFLKKNFDNYYEDNQTKFENIKDGVKNAFEGSPEPIKPIKCLSHDLNENLFLLPGHMELSSYDPQLNLSLTASLTLTVLQNLPGAFYKLIMMCAEENNIDYVIIDLNPSLSAINQVLFMSSDAFIVPTNPDPFSVMAISTLKTILPRWKKASDALCPQTEGASYPLPKKNMYFVGEIISRFNVRSEKPASYYLGKIKEIKKVVNDDLVVNLKHNSMINPSDTRTDFCLAEIKDFGGLNQIAMSKNKPVIALNSTNDDLGTGSVKANAEKNISLFMGDFLNVVDMILLYA